ncbi:hypothetical protein EBB54_15550 [Schaedlerella arabinosiphila]|uniref:Glycosyltransferase RgtA/B/C/D-like domain-containing protein n=1 Tax=Schaedlerella arabinosiphila TaxID=2044587 RepID=A0A3R8L0X0_9FIRM|nr:hypothetical protein [Schaedlerella arabinosiphila]RRK32612.1 hypothetical protein EBB54_15550 [Schaedlerella arabinosiphila]
MKEIIKSYKSAIPIILFLVFLFTSGIHIGINKVLLLIIAQLIFIFYPGLTIVRRIKGISFRNKLSLYFSSYAVGYVVCILCYAILLICGFQKYTLAMLIALSVISYIVNHFLGDVFIDINEDIQDVDIIFICIIFLIAYIVGVIIYQIPNRSAIDVGYTDIERDLTYWFKNCVASTKGYPLPELSIKGLRLYWHLFSCFQVSLLHYATGIEIYDICFSLAFIWELFLLIGAIYTLGSQLMSRPISIAAACIVVLFSSGADAWTGAYYQYHIFRCSLGFIEGCALSIFAFSIFLKFLSKRNIRGYILTLVMLSGALGLKASGGVVLLVGIASMLFLNGITYKKLLSNVLLLIGCCLIFYLVSKVFIIDGNALISSTSSHQLSVSATKSLFLTGHYREIYTSLSVGFLGKYVALMITLILYIFQSNYAVFPVFILAIIILIKHIKYDCKDHLIISVGLFWMVSVGGLLFFLISHPGFSQIYFYFEIFSFAILFSLYIIEQNLSEKKWRCVITIEFCLIFICIVNIINNWKTIYIIDSNDYKLNFEAVSQTGNDVTANEILGLRWIRDNTPNNAVLLTNKILYPDSFRSFITSAYTERQVYIEGFGSTNLPNTQLVSDRISLCQSYYCGDEETKNILVEEGVTHAVVFKSKQDANIILPGEIVYENNDIVVLDLVGYK